MRHGAARGRQLVRFAVDWMSVQETERGTAHVFVVDGRRRRRTQPAVSSDRHDSRTRDILAYIRSPSAACQSGQVWAGPGRSAK